MTTCGSAKNNRISILSHGVITFGFDRLCSLFGGADSIRDFIAFPKNNSGRDVMIDSPSEISGAQFKELSIKTDVATK